MSSKTDRVEVVLTCGSWQEAQRVADELLQKYLVDRIEFLEVAARQQKGKALAAGAREIKLIMETVAHQLENIEQAVRPLLGKGLAALEQTAHPHPSPPALTLPVPIG